MRTERGEEDRRSQTSKIANYIYMKEGDYSEANCDLSRDGREEAWLLEQRMLEDLVVRGSRGSEVRLARCSASVGRGT